MREKNILQANGAILNSSELEEHMKKIGANESIDYKTDGKTYPIPRLIENYKVIKETYNILNEHVRLGISIHPAGEWILDNFYIIEETVKGIQQGLSKKIYKNFVGISDGQYKGFARVYILATEIVNYSDNKINIDNLEKYLTAYQTKKTLNMDEIWNIGLFIQVAIIENIREICEKIYLSQIEKYRVESIIERLIDKKENRKFINFNKKIKNYAELKYPFVEYMSYKLKRYGKKTAKHLEILEEEIEKTGTTVSDIIKKEHFNIAIYKVSMGNCITSIKKIQRINFLEIFEKINGVEEILKLDPANVYDKMDSKTKDYYRQTIKEISKRSKISEIYIGKKLLELANNGEEKKNHIGYYLFGKNQNILYKKIGSKTKKIMNENEKAKYYICITIVLTIILSIITEINLLRNIPMILNIIGIIFLLIPSSEIVTQTVQYILGKFVKPNLIPKIDFSQGIDEQHSTVVVIPTIIKSKEKVQELMRKLEVFYLANKSENLYFYLLGDASESTRKIEEFDKEVFEEGCIQAKELNQKYKRENLFNFLYRKRVWNEKQESYLGWERKRGALSEFVQYLRNEFSYDEIQKKYWGNVEKIAKVPKYLITLDSDTDLVLNSAFEMIGAMSHILNKPEIKNGRVISGYGLIQPRVGVNIDVSYKNMFTKIFAGSGGIDSYSNAVSDLYQDNFGEGIFTGKGIFDLEVYSNVLKGEIPENQVLSHDLLEGSYLRCGLASDILVMDGYPTKYMSFITRLARWIRGDWQIAQWLKNKKLNILSKYKIFDNLRRSLFEISVIVCGLYFGIISEVFKLSNINIILFLILAVIFPFLLEVLNMIIFKREGEQTQKTFVPKITGFMGAIYRAVLTFGCLPYKAYISGKSICTSIYRMYFSKKKLLEWVTSEEAEKNSKSDVMSYYKSMWFNWIAGTFVIILSILEENILLIFAGLFWVIIPWIMYDISKENKANKKKLKYDQEKYIKDVARRTFNYFYDNINKENNYLIPDNYQEDRKEKYVNRTSSTNIGLSLLTIMSGIDLEFISLEEGTELILNIIEIIEGLEKWNGHLYNWYNIKNKNPLMPRYISTVDSGNFVGYLYVTRGFFYEKYKKDDEKIKNIIDRISNLIENTDFSKLYSKQHGLFSIGFNVEDGKLSDSYYDLLASEARQASIVAIAKKDIPSKHWNNLSRALTILNRKKGLISWAGTAFEYLMPNINIQRFEGTLLDESSKFAIMSQIEYAKKLNIPWGISEAAFNVKDLHGNYQYKAFGIPWLGLKRGLADEMVVASYGSILAITDKPYLVYKNLKLLEQYGMYGKYGFYESLDFTIQRLKRGENLAVVQTYMAHHQALSLLSITNYFKDNIFQKRFITNPEIEAVSILLQERMPETFIITKEEKEEPNRLKYKDYENYAEIVYDKVDNRLVRSNVISNENYMVAINQKGEGISKYKNIYVNRYKSTNDYAQGIFFYVKNIRDKQIWWSGSENTISTFGPADSKFERVDGNIKTTFNVTIDCDEAVEIRRLELENIGQDEEKLEVCFNFEPILSSKEQDYAHPAFNNLFLKFDYDYENNILEVKRKKRGDNEKELYLEAKFSTDGETIVDNEFEISSEKVNSRGNLGIPTSIINSSPMSNKAGLATEPIIEMKKTIKILPRKKINLDFIISVNEEKQVAIENLNKYNNCESVRRLFEVSKARAEAENRYFDIKGKEAILYQKILGYIIFNNPIRKRQMAKIADRIYNQSELWKYGISGDIPILLIELKDMNDAYIVNQILKMYKYFRSKNIKTDIVFLDEEKYSYENFLRGEIEAKISDEHLDYMKNIDGGIYVLSKSEINNNDVDLLKFVASVVIDARQSDLENTINDWEEEFLSTTSQIDDYEFENINMFREEKNEQEDILENKDELKYYNEFGAFSPDGKEYFLSQNKNNRLPSVWSNILANEKFGTIVTENMGGYTWYKNSRLNRITAWSNKAFLDIPSEIIYMQDKENGETWSLSLNPMPDNHNYNVIHGFGYSKYIHTSDDIKQEFDVFVPNEDSIKVGILKLNNNSLSKKNLRIVYYAKPVLGEDEIKSNNYIKVNLDNNYNILQAQNLYENEFRSIAYLASSEKIKSYTGDKDFFLGKGGVSNPDGMKKYRLNQDNGIGKKSCMAIEIDIEIESLSNKEIVILLGAEDNVSNVRNTVAKFSSISYCKQELENVKKKWKDILERIQVYTPMESVNILLNGWLLYQTISSRLLGKTGFYQSGGAYGFRDQLQDSLSLKYIDPTKIKNQILKHSKHQFIEGDVEHWWHEDTGRGIRTKFSDDLLWLPFVVEQYIEVTGDEGILDIETNYTKGEVLYEEQDEKYDLFEESSEKENIFMHCVRAIDRALNFGEHGLPKIGTGDWNDGLNTVGNKGKGESVWLGFFLYLVLKEFIPICEKRDQLKADEYRRTMDVLQKNLNSKGWDGRWFKRAYTDDGQVLGSIENEECRIDSIAQSWSVISGAGDNDKKFISIYSLENHLIDNENGIIKLLDPPFENGKLQPGYIKAYLPGVRENGGQYTHAAVWAIIAEAILGFGDKATELYRMINPIEHTRTKEAAKKYKVEPYVIPADVYGASNLAGRGGWTWYTGSSSWYYVAGIEYILGMKIRGNILSFEPCISREWKEYNIRYKFENSVYNIKVTNLTGKNTGVNTVKINGIESENKIILDGSGKIFNVDVEM